MEATVTISIKEYDKLREAINSIRGKNYVVLERKLDCYNGTMYFLAYTENEVIKNQNDLIKKLYEEINELKKKNLKNEH